MTQRATLAGTVGVAMVAAAVYALPPLADILVYDRQAILAGAVWRLFTAPLVHFSIAHLAWNLAVFVAAGWASAMAEDRNLWVACGLAILLPGPVLLLIAPDLAYYGGLSGAATAAVAYYCACRALASAKRRSLWLGILLLMMGKIAVEMGIDQPLFATIGELPFRPLPAVHLLSFAAAMVVALRDRKPQPVQPAAAT